MYHIYYPIKSIIFINQIRPKKNRYISNILSHDQQWLLFIINRIRSKKRHYVAYILF